MNTITIKDLQEMLVSMIEEGFGNRVLLNGFDIWDFIYNEYSTTEQTKENLQKAMNQIVKELERDKNGKNLCC